MKPLMLIALIIGSLAGCTTPITLPSSGVWESHTEKLGPVVVCRGGNFSSEPEGCNQWPLSVPSMPAPDVHYAELRAKAAELYKLDPSMIVLSDVQIEYTAEINGVIRGWRATALAGKQQAAGK